MNPPLPSLEEEPEPTAIQTITPPSNTMDRRKFLELAWKGGTALAINTLLPNPVVAKSPITQEQLFDITNQFLLTIKTEGHNRNSFCIGDRDGSRFDYNGHLPRYNIEQSRETGVRYFSNPTTNDTTKEEVYRALELVGDQEFLYYLDGKFIMVSGDFHVKNPPIFEIKDGKRLPMQKSAMNSELYKQAAKYTPTLANSIYKTSQNTNPEQKLMSPGIATINRSPGYGKSHPTIKLLEQALPNSLYPKAKELVLATDTFTPGLSEKQLLELLKEERFQEVNQHLASFLGINFVFKTEDKKLVNNPNDPIGEDDSFGLIELDENGLPHIKKITREDLSKLLKTRYTEHITPKSDELIQNYEQKKSAVIKQWFQENEKYIPNKVTLMRDMVRLHKDINQLPENVKPHFEFLLQMQFRVLNIIGDPSEVTIDPEYDEIKKIINSKLMGIMKRGILSFPEKLGPITETDIMAIIIQESGGLSPYAELLRPQGLPPSADNIIEFNQHNHTEKNPAIEAGEAPTDSGKFFWNYYDPETDKEYRVTTGFPSNFLKLDQDLALTAGIEHINTLWNVLSERTETNSFQTYYNQLRTIEPSASVVVDNIIEDLTSQEFSEHDAQMAILYLIYNTWFSKFPYIGDSYPYNFNPELLKTIKNGGFQNISQMTEYINKGPHAYGEISLPQIIYYLYRKTNLEDPNFLTNHIGEFGGPKGSRFLNPISK